VPANNVITLDPKQMKEREPYHLLTSIVAPRSIVWVSTISADGVPNLAPFSFYTAVAGFPPTIMFSVSYRVQTQAKEKDTLRNIYDVNEFVSHVVDEKMAEPMIQTSVDYPYGVNEFEIVNLETLPSVVVKPLRIAHAPVAMECKVTQIIPVEDSTNIMILGEVVRFHIREELYRSNGLVDTIEMKPIARLGGPVEYAKIGNLFHLAPPSGNTKG